MHRIHTLTLALCALLAGCGSAPVSQAPAAPTLASAAPATNTSANAMLAAWTGDFGGTPAFDQMQIADLEPAVKEAIRAHLAQLDQIAQQPAAANFENTVVAMEKTGELVNRALVYFSIYSGNLSSPEFREVQAKLSPLLAEYENKITQNSALFARVKSVYNSAEMAGLRPDQRRLVTLVYNQFVRSGAELSAEKAKRYAAIDAELAGLYTKFQNHVLADEEKYLYLGAELAGGLPESFVSGAKAIATGKGQAGKFAIVNTRSSVDPFLTSSTERALREQVWRAFYSRGDNADQNDNNALISEILKLRHERSKLLGFANYAEWRLADRMAKTPNRAMALMQSVWPAAIARVKEEVADMQKIADAAGDNITIEPWDYRYYAEKVRQQRFAYDSEAVKQYLNLEQLTEAMFYVAGELFDFKFTALAPGKVPVYHPDVRVWEVTRLSNGAPVGLWYLDPYAREGKRSGAWASSYRNHQTQGGPSTVLSSNNSNFIKAADGEPVLVSWDDANTFFHEFGHALHSLSSTVDYDTLNGGVRDYTEFQSQLLQRWLFTEPVINKYFRHAKTGAPMPAELVQKLKNSASFNQGFGTTEYLASSIIDLKLHMIDPANLDPDAFERDTLNQLGMPKEVVMRHRTPQFGHVFAGEGYAAGYYGYLWADVLSSDAAEAFAGSPGGFYDKTLGKSMVANLFSVRNAVDPAEAYRAFRGRDAEIAPLLRDRGFPVPKAIPVGK